MLAKSFFFSLEKASSFDYRILKLCHLISVPDLCVFVFLICYIKVSLTAKLSWKLSAVIVQKRSFRSFDLIEFSLWMNGWINGASDFILNVIVSQILYLNWHTHTHAYTHMRRQIETNNRSRSVISFWHSIPHIWKKNHSILERNGKKCHWCARMCVFSWHKQLCKFVISIKKNAIVMIWVCRNSRA